MNATVTRRGFFGALTAALGGLFVGRLPAMPSLEEEVVDLDWMRAAKLDGETHWQLEARFCVNGGPWQIKREKSRRAFMWLTQRVGVGWEHLDKLDKTAKFNEERFKHQWNEWDDMDWWRIQEERGR